MQTLGNRHGANTEQAIHQKLEQEIEKVHQDEQQKIINLTKFQTTNITNNNINYPRVINYTNTQFTQDETKLRNKGMKYSLHHNQKGWIKYYP
jgi:hypothetical protein